MVTLGCTKDGVLTSSIAFLRKRIVRSHAKSRLTSIDCIDCFKNTKCRILATGVYLAVFLRAIFSSQDNEEWLSRNRSLSVEALTVTVALIRSISGSAIERTIA